MEQEEPRAQALRQRLAIDDNFVVRADRHGGRGQKLAIDGDAPFGDPGLGVAARAEPGPGHDLGDALAPRRRGVGFARRSAVACFGAAMSLVSIFVHEA
jgi:hypothetical protein